MTRQKDLLSIFNGEGDITELELLRKYTGGQAVHIDKTTGLVFVKERRDAYVVGDEWSNAVYESSSENTLGYRYTGLIPIMKSRHLFAVDSLNNTIPGGIKGKSVLDIGAGEGYFLTLARDLYGADVFGIEPSSKNCLLLNHQDINNFNGTVEDYFSHGSLKGKFDVVTLNWTLCNCSNINSVISKAFELLSDNGYIMVSDSSRLLTPFKKSLSLYFEPSLPIDLHPWFFSFNSIRCLMAVHGFAPIFQNNHHEQNDLIIIAGKKANIENSEEPEAYFDDYRDVINFFERWEKESQFYKSRDRGSYNLIPSI